MGGAKLTIIKRFGLDDAHSRRNCFTVWCRVGLVVKLATQPQSKTSALKLPCLKVAIDFNARASDPLFIVKKLNCTLGGNINQDLCLTALTLFFGVVALAF